MGTIEAEIIPRLLLAHRTQPARPVPLTQRSSPTAEEVSGFADLVVADLSTCLVFVEKLAVQGLSLESLLLELITPAARLLGDLWTADLRTFTDVNIGLANLQQVVYSLSPTFSPEPGIEPPRGLVVLAPAPGEQHTLGVQLAGELIREAGWSTSVEPSTTENHLLELVQEEHVDMLGISVSNTEFVEPLAGIITSVRVASCNPHMLVVLGGPVKFGDYGALTGATSCVTDARQAVALLDEYEKAHATGE